MSVGQYQVIEKIGEGAHGWVYKAIASDGSFVALKKVKAEHDRDGFPIAVIREIQILTYCRHPNIIPLTDLVLHPPEEKKGDGRALTLVFPYMDHDLSGLMDNPMLSLCEGQIKYYVKSILKGLAYLHEHDIIHRDIKASNILVNNAGQVKLTDFGLARWENPLCGMYTNRMITLWYRPPELLYGEQRYGTEVDVWSTGCILAELLLGRAPFPGRAELDQIDKIFSVLGTPTSDNWPGFVEMPWYGKLTPNYEMPDKFDSVFAKLGKSARDLLRRMLSMDPKKRISAEEALNHEYFHIEPLPWELKDHPQYSHSHSYKTKKRRKSGAFRMSVESKEDTRTKSSKERITSSREDKRDDKRGHATNGHNRAHSREFDRDQSVGRKRSRDSYRRRSRSKKREDRNDYRRLSRERSSRDSDYSQSRNRDSHRRRRDSRDYDRRRKSDRKYTSPRRHKDSSKKYRSRSRSLERNDRRSRDRDYNRDSDRPRNRERRRQRDSPRKRSRRYSPRRDSRDYSPYSRRRRH